MPWLRVDVRRQINTFADESDIGQEEADVGETGDVGVDLRKELAISFEVLETVH